MKNFTKYKKVDLFNILQCREDQVIYIGDLSDEAPLELIVGNPNYPHMPNMFFEVYSLIDYIDFDNEYVEIEGKKKWLKYVENCLFIAKRSDHHSFVLPIKTKQGKKYFKFNFSKVKIGDEIKRILYVSDINEFGSLQEQFYSQTYKDHLTGLFKRGTLEYHIGLIKHTNINKFVYLDIDNFKSYNDTYGHSFGDKVLKLFADKTVELIKSPTYFDKYKILVYRISGDEFMIMTNNVEDDELLDFIDDLKANLSNLTINDINITIDFSYGIYTSTENDSYNEIIKKADELMYINKTTKKQNVKEL